ncbi:hypothetical protein V5799_006379 [Amblyomma americanum]|uniref:Uncharacterized protein n=1 Tax=Amblyomma americanum TaxID=6943 RepID=A0AAQ4DWJ7_AMBAM
MSEVRDVRRAAQRAFAATAVTTADASQTTERLEPGAGPQVANVAVLQVYWHVSSRFNGVPAAAVLCAVALFIYSVSVVRIRIGYRHLLHADSRTDYIDHARLSLSPGCDSTACEMCTGATEYSLNRSQDPSNSFYRLTRDGWKHEHRLLSVLDAAEDIMYGRALNAIDWAPRNILKPISVQTAASSVVRRAVELARSCIEPSESSLHVLKMLMADHHIPWPQRSRWELFEILLDLSGNGNLHLWLQVTFDLRRSRKVTGDPVLKIGHSAAFRTWIAVVRTFAGQPRGSAQSVWYQQYVRSMLRLFDLSQSPAGELVATIEAMNRLTLAALWPATAEPGQRILRMCMRNLTETTSTGISAEHLLLLLNEHHIWALRLSSIDIVRIENPGLLRAVVYLFGLKFEMREALTLSLALRVASVTALRVYWTVNPRFNGVLAAAIFCAVALFVYSESEVWIRIRYRHLFHAASRAAYTDHACLPFSFGCDSTACKMYTGATEYPLNRSQDPCNNFYRFVRDDWKHEYHLLSVIDAAEDMMYGRALNTIEWAPRAVSGVECRQKCSRVCQGMHRVLGEQPAQAENGRAPSPMASDITVGPARDSTVPLRKLESALVATSDI